MKKNNTNLMLAILIILLIIFSGLFGYLLSVIKNKNNHISAVTSTLAKKKIEKKNIDVLEKKMTELVQTQKDISGYLVDTSNIDRFVEYLESIGVDNSIELSVKSVDIIKNENNKILVNVSTKGSFMNIMKVLLTIENSPYSLNIASLYLNKEIVQTTPVLGEPVKTKNSKISKTKVAPLPPKSLWQMDMSFNILTL